MKSELYRQQLIEKELRINNIFKSPLNLSIPIEIFESEEMNYRQRAEFRVWHNGEDLFYFMFDKETQEKIRITTFNPASIIINQAMTLLLDLIKKNQQLRFKLFQVDFLSTLSGEILITMIYHKKLTEEWTIEANNLRHSMSDRFNLQIVGRAKKQKIEIDRDYVIEKLTINNKVFHYKQIENSFTQPNAKIAIQMLEWVQSVCKNIQGDLLELYCGNGNFSIALADQFEKVLATEISTSSIEAAKFNCEVNGISNISFVRMSSEEFSEALRGERKFNRLKEIELERYNFKLILVDPPRAGVDLDTLKLMSQYESILYISCNPETLKLNLDILLETHEVNKIALFDQFPFTHHIEAGVFLKKRVSL